MFNQYHKMVNWLLSGLFIFMLGACSRAETPVQKQLADKQPDIKSQSPVVLVLGIAQDAGYPQANCEKEQCKKYWQGEEHARYVSSIALVDPLSQSAWLFDATPDFKHQLKMLKIQYPESTLRGIFLTHAHIGHYTGLMQLGHEVMGASGVPVYAMPQMTTFLQTNGPWSQLVHYGNISLQPLHADQAINLTPEISVTPFIVPHRDEYSETVGYNIQSSDSSLLYIPDINKWEVWNRSIENEIRKVHFALLDGTFYDANELPGRNMTEIPHPFIQESLDRFSSLPLSEKKKIMFIHFNHTNPLILDSPEREYVEKLGYRVAKEGDKIKL
mgnify:FL=1